VTRIGDTAPSIALADAYATMRGKPHHAATTTR
jgi:hypothetical protein